jgi:hypothetical protein
MHHVYGDSLDIYNNLGESIEHRLIFSVPLLKSSVYFEQKSAIVLACLVGYGADLSQDYSSRISATCSEGRHPSSGRHRVGYFKGMGMLIGPVGDPNFGPSGSSSATWNLAWNCGL